MLTPSPCAPLRGNACVWAGAAQAPPPSAFHLPAEEGVQGRQAAGSAATGTRAVPAPGSSAPGVRPSPQVVWINLSMTQCFSRLRYAGDSAVFSLSPLHSIFSLGLAVRRAVLTGRSTEARHTGVNVCVCVWGASVNCHLSFLPLSSFHDHLFSNLMIRSMILDLFLKDNNKDISIWKEAFYIT